MRTSGSSALLDRERDRRSSSSSRAKFFLRPHTPEAPVGGQEKGASALTMVIQLNNETHAMEVLISKNTAVTMDY